MIRLRPDLVWLDDRFHRNRTVLVDPDTGRIADVPGSGASAEDAARDVPLPGRALLPGFVNAHSHAFQRLARGRTQWRPAGRASADFWSWREAMYGIALELSADQVQDVSRFCFLEMLRAGITAVGEFHYLHHQPDGGAYHDPNELAFRIIAAAEEVGLRIALLNVCYATGGIARPLETRQRRFRARSLDAFLERTDRLHASVGSRRDPDRPGGGLVSVGVAPHSIRAVPRDWLPELRTWAADRDLPLHMHVSEQPAEVESCEAAYGLRPVQLLAEDGILDERFTAVHATHLTAAEVAALGGAGATVCACPTTERDLGDGFLPGVELLDAGVAIALGTDSHTNIDMLDEMRLVEYHERLRRRERVVVVEKDPAGDDRLRVAPALLRMATASGAAALRLDAGEIAAGRLADLVAVDLGHISLAGWTDDSLGDMIALSASCGIVRDAWIGGTRRLEDGRHADEEEIGRRFDAVARATA